ncbi:Tad domain-containing protein [Alteraurantiacibacter buctensis]|nr:Tad domain-containing protein [Alteraurantiacibacter buctensis]
MAVSFQSWRRGAARFLARLSRETAGNVIIIVAASLFPLLALVGSGIDMGRGYLAETRLQQACDAGVLAARKRLGTAAAVSTTIPSSAADTGQRFFNLNFRNRSYGSNTRSFSMRLNEDYSVSGTATADIETTVMAVFGFESIPVSVACQAQINMGNMDVMMVLDTTGSMSWTNPGDSQTRIQALRATVKSFYAQMEASKTPGSRIRYGFVPYSTNVNVGHLLQDDWLVDEWNYNYRLPRSAGGTTTRPIYETRYTYISGTFTNTSSYVASSCPASTQAREVLSETVDADGWTVQQIKETGTRYNCSQIDANTYTVSGTTYNDHRFAWASRQTGMETVDNFEWRYASMPVDLDFLESSNSTTVPMGGTPLAPTDVTVSYRGCIEERSTYEINNYGNVDLGRALDLDIDRVPDRNNPDTQWRPMLNELSYLREVRTNGQGMFTPGPVRSPLEFVNSWWWGYGACPQPAQKLQVMTAAQIATYVDNLVPQGSTYHDIGMIWGGRLLSATGLFAAENADVGNVPTTRHMIFLTDGETAPLDISYGSYGIEPLDRRRWRPTSSMSLTQTVEARFSFACEEVKRRNIQVWVVSFGTSANAIMQNCAGSGHYFVAANAAELQNTFSEIARRMAALRITR